MEDKLNIFLMDDDLIIAKIEDNFNSCECKKPSKNKRIQPKPTRIKQWNPIIISIIFVVYSCPYLNPSARFDQYI